MQKIVNQFTQGTSGDHYFFYSSVPNIGEAIVFNNTFRQPSDVHISKAFIKINCEYSVNELTVYWDKTGELTDFSNIDENPNVVKLDYSASGNTYMTFDVTKIFAEFQKAGTPTKNQRVIVTGISFIVQEDEPEYSISVYYDYNRTVKDSKATVPFELSNANANIDLSDKSVKLSYSANSGFGRMPVSINFYYDSSLTNDIERIYLENNTYKEIEYNCGNGWKHNFQQYIVADRSSALHGDGETYAYYTWINGQGGHIVFCEKFYAVINGRNKYLNLSQVLFDADKNMSYVENGITYPVIHCITSDTNYTLTITQDEISNEYYYRVSDIIGNAFSFGEMLDTSIASLRYVFDNYDNYIYLIYDENEKLVTIKSQATNEQNVLIDLNTVNLTYNQAGKLYQFNELLEDNSTLTTTITMSSDNRLLLGFITPENHRNLELTYYTNNKLETVIDALGTGFYLENIGSSTKIISIAKNGGIVNGEIVPITDTTNTKIIGQTRYKFVDIYKITYSELSAQLELIRDKEKMTYLFDCYGRCVSEYSNIYDGEGLGNPQGASFVINGENIKIGVQNVFESNDLCQDAS